MQRRILYSALSFALFASGCELIANFDRSKIPGNQADSGMIVPPPGEEDAGIDVDAAVDAGSPKDASERDAGS